MTNFNNILYYARFVISDSIFNLLIFIFVKYPSSIIILISDRFKSQNNSFLHMSNRFFHIYNRFSYHFSYELWYMTIITFYYFFCHYARFVIDDFFIIFIFIFYLITFGYYNSFLHLSNIFKYIFYFFIFF